MAFLCALLLRSSILANTKKWLQAVPSTLMTVGWPPHNQFVILQCFFGASAKWPRKWTLDQAWAPPYGLLPPICHMHPPIPLTTQNPSYHDMCDITQDLEIILITRLSAKVNVTSASDTALKMLFYHKWSFTVLIPTASFPLHKVKLQELAMKFVKWIRYTPH